MKQRLESQSRNLNLVSDDTFVTRSEFEDFQKENYSKMRVGLKTLDDAVMNLGTHRKVNPNYGNKEFILRAIDNHDYATLREISNYFYEASGIYQRLCKYLAFLYRYDWYVTPFIYKENVKESKILSDYSKLLSYFDNSDIKRLFGNIALEVIKSGSFYGYVVDFEDRFTLQQLPSGYCRSRFFQGVDPVIELNLKFFDDYFSNIQYRLKVLSMFPKEIQKAYILFKENKLIGDYPGDKKGWYMLDPALTIKFSLNNSDFPTLAGAIPSLIDLDQAQELDRKKTMQQLLKIVIQKLPLDKNGDLIFDPEEGKDLHNNAVAMLKRAIGVDVLTTFADIEVADMQDKNTTTTTDGLMKVERTAYNNSGISQNLFNTDGNLSLEKSIANDEASLRDLILQFGKLLNRIGKKFNNGKNYEFKTEILETTIYNYKELAKMYKEQTQLGYNKMLPQVALGHSQAYVLASIQFENNILHLSEIMVPPMSSNTMSGKTQGNSSKSQNTEKQNKSSEKEVGRKELPDSEKSEKTIQNKEAMS